MRVPGMCARLKRSLYGTRDTPARWEASLSRHPCRHRHSSKSFLVNVIGRLGGDKQDLRELRVLNRVLSWKSGGVQLEADPRHQEILISELEQDVRGLSTPAVQNQ